MRIYEIIDEDNNLSVGVLFYYEKQKTYIIELSEELDEWTAPLLFTNLVRQKRYTVPRELSIMWVRERIIPSGRQNISDILRNHKLESYDEMKFLELSKGKCSQDSCYIKKLSELPDFAEQRRLHNLTNCAILDDNNILCFFEDGIVRKIDINVLSGIEGFDKVIENRKLFETCMVGAGGYYITFNDSIDVDRSFLYDAGIRIPMTLSDFKAFITGNVYDTTQTCDALECSRQNLAYMIKRDQLTPVKENVKGSLFLKDDVFRNMW